MDAWQENVSKYRLCFYRLLKLEKMYPKGNKDYSFINDKGKCIFIVADFRFDIKIILGKFI